MSDQKYEDYHNTQIMIEINARHLNGLRTECELSESLTQFEIRKMETKLIRMFGRQIIEHQLALLDGKLDLPPPLTHKWLHVVGLHEDLIERIIEKIDDFHKLIDLNEDKLDELMDEHCSATADEKRRLKSAMSNLKLYIEKSKLNDPTLNDLNLHWDSWDYEIESNEHSDDDSTHHLTDANENRSNCPSPLDESKVSNKNNQRQHDTETFYPVNKSSMPKSESHEGHFMNKIDRSGERANFAASHYNRQPLASEHCDDYKSYNRRSPPIASSHKLYNAQSDNYLDELTSSMHSLNNNRSCNLNTPRSPRTQRMHHSIKHRFVQRRTPKITTCDLCTKQLIFGIKCTECKCKYHTKCARKVPPSCGLPSTYFEIFKQTLNNCDYNAHHTGGPWPQNSFNHQNYLPPPSSMKFDKKNKQNKPTDHDKHSPNSSSNASSRDSSVPSSPSQPSANNSTPCSTNVNTVNSARSSAFTFNASDKNSHHSSCTSGHSGDGSNEKRSSISKQKNEINNFRHPETSDRVRSDTSADPLDELTATLESQVERLNSQDSQQDYDQMNDVDKNWPRQNSLTIKDWDIPWNEVVIEKEIGVSRFGMVFRGKWHGPVAIKMFNMANWLDDERALKVFRSQVSTFCKTRHENLVLFMGACMSPPHLAIVTSYCEGLPLFNHLYERKEKFNLNHIINISSQIAQGMDYLHARGIIHRDLRTKNIFFDNSNNKVIIADFGIFSLTKLCSSNDKHKDRLKIPKGWLCYLAPELMKALKAGDYQEKDDQDKDDQDKDDLPFSFATDIFSFGTVWHELIFGFMPFEDKPAEVVIWQVGKGIKQSLINLQASKEIKDILMLCWSYKANERPDFKKLSDILTNLPKRRLQRSPSHPTHLMTKHHF